MSTAVTQGIEISVENWYLAEKSDPDQNSFIFVYEVTIQNHSAEAARVLTRHWIIKDARNRVEEVRGEGVIGKTPLIEPGESFTYNSWCPLRTPYGTMRGSYGMVWNNGQTFEADIAPFVLLPHYMLN